MSKSIKTGLVLKSAAIAGVAAMGFATQALAANPPEANPTTGLIELTNSSMVQSYTAYVGTDYAHRVDAYSNGVTFTYENLNPATSQPVNGNLYTLYGFCVDVAHDMSLGSLNLVYTDSYNPTNNPPADPLPNNFFPGTNPSTVNIDPATTLPKLTALIDTGWLLHEQELENEQGPNSNSTAIKAVDQNIDLQEAAIQSAIWYVEGAYVSINFGGSTAGSNAYVVQGANEVAPVGLAGGTSLTGLQYFDDYAGINGGTFTDLGDRNDSFYTIVEKSPYDGTQSFAVGWPIPGVPEPTTWALMLVGFGGLGAMLRLRRKQALATA